MPRCHRRFFGDVHDIHGEDLLRALELATAFLNLLSIGLSEQYDVIFPDGERYSSDDVMA